ncbi:GA-like domain-containing protein, partial [Acinetobacter guillouiae]|uniref:GA-like domain-containing protein n=1 Tax=Acinetobacter guillouiae TaxID=106649 RepID=UPI003AF7AF86
LIAAAGDLVAAAEQAYQDAQTALTAAQSDNIITQGEFDALTQALADAQAAKADAQAAVDALPAVVQTEKDALQDRIDDLTDISVPPVTPVDLN